MSKKVFANGNSVAGKAMSVKVIAAFPDVCMSPPSPPAGPVPIPYPDSSFTKDLKDGSKTVLVGGKPIALKSSSHLASSPLGNEAATKSFGAGVVSHQITGKTFFAMWSMDVKAQGKNVCRHLDIATCNHGSPGNSPPMPAAGSMSVGGTGSSASTGPLCECCGQPMHDGQKDDSGNPAPTVSEDKWYCLDEGPEIEAAIEALVKPHPLNKKAVKRFEAEEAKLEKRWEELQQRKDAVANARAKGCESLPEPPCNVYRVTPTGSADKIATEWDAYRPTYLSSNGYPSGTKTNHRVPKVAGGCPGNAASQGNLVHDSELSADCLKADDELGKAQSSAARIWETKGPPTP